MRDVNRGYEPDHTLVASYSLPQKQYSTQPSIDQFNLELIRRLQTMPSVKSVGLSSFLPASGNNNSQAFIADGYTPPNHTIDLATSVQVQGDYFAAMRIPLLSGRYTTADDTKNSQLVVVVNHMLAEQTWPGQNPIGKRLRVGQRRMQIPWLTVVGEVADVKENSPDEASKQQYYLPIDQVMKDFGSLANPGDLNGNGGYIALRTGINRSKWRVSCGRRCAGSTRNCR